MSKGIELLDENMKENTKELCLAHENYLKAVADIDKEIKVADDRLQELYLSQRNIPFV